MYKSIKIYWEVALRIFAYIKSAPRNRLLYKKHGQIHISTYSDVVEYAGNKVTRSLLPIT